MSQNSVIKTTAMLHEASEPDRQKPIIRIDDRSGRTTTLTCVNDATELANTIRASIDSGRDNPFRPDGVIYRMTDPIVDFYKLGPGQSRTQTPTYAELNGHSGDSTRDSQSKSSKSSSPLRFWSKSKAPKELSQGSNQAGSPDSRPAPIQVVGTRKRSCWRKWFCCCCCSDKSNKSSPTAQTSAKRQNGGRHEQLDANIDYYNRTISIATPNTTTTTTAKSEDLITTTTTTNNTKQLVENNGKQQRPWRLAANDESTNVDSIVGGLDQTLNRAGNGNKQIRVVILDEQPHGRRETPTVTNGNAQAPATNGHHATSDAQQAKQASRSNSGKCIVS